MDDPRLKEVRKIDFSKSRIIQTPPIIFLCGGTVDPSTEDSLSARESLLEHLKNSHAEVFQYITLAESFKDWMHHSIYDDLLEFEEDLAGFATLIILMLESPGSLAELGAFVANDNLRSKLVAFMSDEHYAAESFIRLGPINQIENKVSEKMVKAYDWNTAADKVATIGAHVFEEMSEDIKSIVSDLDDTTSVRPTNNGQKALCVYELIRVFHALRVTEIQTYLKEITSEDIDLSSIKKHIFLLKKFGMIKSFKRGHIDYFIATTTAQRIHFAGGFDTANAMISSRIYYELNPQKEGRRHRLISEYEIGASEAM